MRPKRKQHPHNALTPMGVRNQREPGRYADGNGLYLVVDPSGAKRWLLRTVIMGKRTDMGLGSVRLVPLADARKKAIDYRGAARDGGDPMEARRTARRIVPTFEQAADAVHTSHKAAWRNAKHRDQWINTLRLYVCPELGKVRVDRIGTADVLRVLSPIWLAKPETARRVRQRMRTVLDWAKAAGHRTGDNPVDSVEQGLPKHADRAEHHAALPYASVPIFAMHLQASDAGASVKLAFEFALLTAARTGEVLGAQWDEIGTDAMVWTIPASRMKAKREHRVPLSQRALAILEVARALGGKPYVFPGRKADVTLSNMAFLMTLRRLETGATHKDGEPETYAERTTAHGMRSAFRDWAAERTNFPREVCETALAHANRDKVEAAYRRSDLFEQRRALMGQWAEFVGTPSESATVHTMQRNGTAGRV
ncbi:MAG: integrase arm-type DNA-binding domain-containing protein [Burkholderiales bacterium]|nr:integrase arm-type DNA-binding domain-containing protein [Burkholderiales bacterium]